MKTVIRILKGIGSAVKKTARFIVKEFKKFRRNSELPDPVEELLPYAREVVVEVAVDMAGKSNGKKRKEALKRLEKETRDWSWKFSEHLFREAIEHACDELDQTREDLEKDVEEEKERASTDRDNRR